MHKIFRIIRLHPRRKHTLTHTRTLTEIATKEETQQNGISFWLKGFSNESLDSTRDARSQTEGPTNDRLIIMPESGLAKLDNDGCGVAKGKAKGEGARCREIF